MIRIKLMDNAYWQLIDDKWVKVTDPNLLSIIDGHQEPVRCPECARVGCTCPGVRTVTKDESGAEIGTWRDMDMPKLY